MSDLEEIQPNESILEYEAINFEEIDEDLATFQEDEMVQQALHRGVDLKKYGLDLEKELKLAEIESVNQYVEHKSKVIELYSEMQECDRVLGRMEEMLHGFQADLGEISSEIKHLQDDSMMMSIKLKNRRNAEEKLCLFLEKINFPASIATNILSPNVNEAFLESIIVLHNRLNYLEKSVPPSDGSSFDFLPSDTQTGKLLIPELEKLKMRAISKIKDYFLNQFNSLRKPKTNIQILQSSSLSKYSFLFQFMQKESPPVADELRTLYVETMGRTVLNLFKNYYNQLFKLEMVVANKNDLIVIEEAAIKSLFTQKIDMSKKNDSFSLSGRDKILEQIEKEPILVHVAIAEGQKLTYEIILRSVLKHLIDASSNEFLFIIEFFKTSPTDTFNRIYGRTLSMILENIENYLLTCFDIVGIILMIKMIYNLRLIMQKRTIPVLDSFFDRLSLLLWPRFKQVFDANLKSVKLAQSKKFIVTELTPHYISRRYAEFISSVILLQRRSTISNDYEESTVESSITSTDLMGIAGGGENMIHNDVQMLRLEIISLLERFSLNFPQMKEQRVFFINNYDLILSIFQDRNILSEEVQKFEELLLHQRELFAEEEIKSFFPKLISFVLKTEQLIADAPDVKLNSEETLIENLVRDFASSWKSGIQQINDDVLLYFANFRNGTEILKQVLTQLLLYYTRFQEIIKKTFPRPPSFTRDIVSTATILMEIKRYSRTF